MTPHPSSTPGLPDDARIHAPLERAFTRLISPFEEFVGSAAGGGLVLMACTLLALIIANSPLAYAYHHLLDTPAGIGFGAWQLHKGLHHWINDGLMTLFFLVVGLEIKREVLVGELAEPRQALLPIVAALGGMVVPALVYVAFNHGGTIAGWGVPMATDIAFAVGVMVLLGKRVPRSLLTFLVALAIADDLGGVAVIALFYTDDLSLSALGVAALLLTLLIIFNRSGIRKPGPYFIVGSALWLAMLKSGVHPTLAGVLTALSIPARPQYDTRFFSGHVRGLMDQFDAAAPAGANILKNTQHQSILQALERGVQLVEAPLQRLEHHLHLPVAFLVVPIFALGNAGIPIPFAQLSTALTEPVALGVLLGLLLGKPAGIVGFTWLALRTGAARLPRGVTFSQIFGVGLLGGIGFTMSIFIAELGFAGQPDNILSAKTGVLFASLVAGVLGFLWLRFVAKPAPGAAD